MNLEFSAPQLQDFEQIVASLLAEGKCACHIINPHKTRILMWKKTENGTTVYYLRIGIQKFISHEQRDRNGEIYWRYFDLPKKEEPAESPPASQSPSASRKEQVNKEKIEPITLDPVTKFNQRREISQKPTAINNHAKSDNAEPAVNSATS